MDGSSRGRGRDVVRTGAAFAGPDDPALLQFNCCRSSEQYDEFEALGFDMDHPVDKAATARSSSGLGDRRAARAGARARLSRTSASSTASTTSTTIRAETPRERSRSRRRPRALKDNAAGGKGTSAAPGTVRAQRADFYENNVGRFISIEANTTEAQVTCTNPTDGRLLVHRPDADGRRLRRHRQPHRRRQPDDLHRPRRQPGLLPVPLPDLPARQQGRRRAEPAS